MGLVVIDVEQKRWRLNMPPSSRTGEGGFVRIRYDVKCNTDHSYHSKKVQCVKTPSFRGKSRFLDT